MRYDLVDDHPGERRNHEHHTEAASHAEASSQLLGSMTLLGPQRGEHSAMPEGWRMYLGLESNGHLDPCDAASDDGWHGVRSGSGPGQPGTGPDQVAWGLDAATPIETWLGLATA